MYESVSFRTLRKGAFPKTNTKGARNKGPQVKNGKPTDKVFPNCYAMDFQGVIFVGQTIATSNTT